MNSLFTADELLPQPIFSEFKLENTLYDELRSLQGWNDLSATQQIFLAIRKAEAKWGENYITPAFNEWQELKKRGYYQ